MPAYRYRAVHVSGRIMRGVATASSPVELARYLDDSQLELIEAREKKTLTKSKTAPFLRLHGHIEPRQLSLFCAQVSDLLKAGVILLDALNDLTVTMEVGVLRDVTQDVTRALNHGSRIAVAFARHPRQFPAVFIAILAAGEASGDIATAFEQVAAYIEGRAKLNERLRRALRYPLFLMLVALGTVSFMMIMVVPQVVSFLRSIDGELPMATRILIAASDFFGAVWWMILLGIAALTLTAFLARRFSKGFALMLDNMLLRIPFIGIVAKKLMLARFAQSFGILLQSGLTIPEGLQGARDTLGNHALEAHLDQVLKDITFGRRLSEAMSGLFPPFAVRILRIGEDGRRLPRSLVDIAAHYDREAADQAERMIGALEPGLTLMIGGILAWVVMAVLGPIYGSLTRINIMG